MDAATSRPAVIIDNGTGYTKMGFAGNVEPCFTIPTVVAVNDSFLNQPRSSAKGSNWLAQHSSGVMADLDFFVGDEALSRSRSNSSYTLTHPIRHGQVDNWDAMERFWQQCIFNYLRCDPEDHYFLLTESPLIAPESREYTGEIMFETFNVPGLYIAVQPVLALAAGYTASKCEMTGVVVDVGDGATHVVPVADGYVIGSSIKSIPIAGNDVTLFIRQLMRERGEHVPPEDSFEVARKVKETYCYTCSDIVKEFNKHDKEPAKHIKQYRGIKPKTGASYSCDIGHERFLGPEVFFNPEIYSSKFTTPLPAVIDKCIQCSPIDTRRALYKNIVLSGGSTMFKDFHRRLQRDVKKIVDARVLASDAQHGGEIKEGLDIDSWTKEFKNGILQFFAQVSLRSRRALGPANSLPLTQVLLQRDRTKRFSLLLAQVSLQRWLHSRWRSTFSAILSRGMLSGLEVLSLHQHQNFFRLATPKRSMKSMGQAFAVQILFSRGCINRRPISESVVNAFHDHIACTQNASSFAPPTCSGVSLLAYPIFGWHSCALTSLACGRWCTIDIQFQL